MEHFETRTQQETLADNFCADLENLETEIDDCSLDFQTTIIDDLNQISDIVMENILK